MRRDYFHLRYENRKSDYVRQTPTIRESALERASQKCEICGWRLAIEVLQVHHKDRNTKNNSLDNLQILCPTCHAFLHFQEKTGFFTPVVDKAKYLLGQKRKNLRYNYTMGNTEGGLEIKDSNNSVTHTF